MPVPTIEAAGKDVKRKLTRVVRILEEKFGPHIYPEDGPQDPVEQIVFAVLAARNPVTNARKAIRDMKDQYLDWNEVRVATVRQLEETLEQARIEPPGRMAVTIKQILMKTFDEVCRVSLEVLRTDGPDRARKIVGKIDVLEPHEQQYLLVAAGIEEAPPLDPATDRIGLRLGIFTEDDAPQKRRKLLESHVASSDALRFHHLMAEHGKKLCTVEDPRCAKCPAQQECDYFRALEAAKKQAEKDRAKGGGKKDKAAEKPEKDGGAGAQRAEGAKKGKAAADEKDAKDGKRAKAEKAERSEKGGKDREKDEKKAPAKKAEKPEGKKAEKAEKPKDKGGKAGKPAKAAKPAQRRGRTSDDDEE